MTLKLKGRNFENPVCPLRSSYQAMQWVKVRGWDAGHRDGLWWIRKGDVEFIGRPRDSFMNFILRTRRRVPEVFALPPEGVST